MSKHSPKWARRFLELAGLVASWSKDPSTQCGAVIVNEKRRVVGLGYNGFPDTVHDCDDLLNDREQKYALIIHAEVNAILNATSSVEGCTVFVNYPSCPDCAKFMVQAGIKEVIWPEPDQAWNERWRERLQTSAMIFKRGGVKTPYDQKKKLLISRIFQPIMNFIHQTGRPK